MNTKETSAGGTVAGLSVVVGSAGWAFEANLWEKEYGEDVVGCTVRGYVCKWTPHGIIGATPQYRVWLRGCPNTAYGEKNFSGRGAKQAAFAHADRVGAQITAPLSLPNTEVREPGV